MDARLIRVQSNVWAIFVDEADLNAVIESCSQDKSSTTAMVLAWTLKKQKEEEQ